MRTIPLLPSPVNLDRDASRSAKQEMARKEIRKSTLNSLVDLPEFEVITYNTEERGKEFILHLYCTHNCDFALCPHCEKLSEHIHEKQSRCVRDLDMGKWRTFLHFTSRRFYCEYCEQPFVEQLQSIDYQRRQTLRFEEFVYQRSLSSTRKAVAKEMWLDPSTVKTIFRRWAKRAIEKQHHENVRVLGIDEISLKKRHKQFALVISDLERHCVIAVLPSRDKESLEKWFSELDKSQRKAIQVVSMDMWRPYYFAVRAKISHAKIVVDRFHVAKQLNEQLTKLRRVTQREADEVTRGILKGSRWLLVKNRENLSEKEEIHLQEILAVSPEVREAYLLKEEFHTIFEKIKNQEQAERFLKAWTWKAEKTGSRYLAKFVKTLRNWWKEILKYFDEGITNGFVEGINRAIRAIINRAYGYRNFENFQLQVLAQHGYPAFYPANSR